MRCPGCGVRITTEAEKTRARRKAKGLCVECGADAGGHWRCLACRQKIAARVQARRQET